MKHQSILPPHAEADGVFFLPITNDRATIEHAVERLIGLLDSMEPDPDSEPWLGWCGQYEHQHGAHDDREDDRSDLEPTMGWQNFGPQAYLQPTLGLDECEEENEHGGDVQDEPHDEDTDREPSLGWTERDGQGFAPHSPNYRPEVQMLEGSFDGDDFGSRLDFRGTGYQVGQHLLRRLPHSPYVRVSPGLVRLDAAALDRIAPIMGGRHG